MRMRLGKRESKLIKKGWKANQQRYWKEERGILMANKRMTDSTFEDEPSGQMYWYYSGHTNISPLKATRY